MAYVSDLVEGVPYKQTLLESNLEALLRVAIGRDDGLGVQYSAQVSLIRLDPFYGEAENAELAFDVVAHDGERATYISDGLHTKPFLVGHERVKVLGVICQAAHMLLQWRNPASVTFSTLQPNLPPKALAKYGQLSEAVQAASYDGGQSDPFDGHRIWMFTKSANVT